MIQLSTLGRRCSRSGLPGADELTHLLLALVEGDGRAGCWGEEEQLLLLLGSGVETTLKTKSLPHPDMKHSSLPAWLPTVAASGVKKV